MSRKILGIIVCMLLVTTVCLPNINGKGDQKNDAQQLQEPRPAPLLDTDWWPMFGHDLTHSHYSSSTTLDDNSILWTYATGGQVISSPAISDGKVYVGSEDYKFYCLDATTGACLWSYPTGYAIWSSPAVSNGYVYVGSSDKKVYCLNAETGAEIWNYTTDNFVTSSPAIADGKLYVGGGDTLYCLDAATGACIWNKNNFGFYFSSPAVSNGKIYIGSESANVSCLDAQTGTYVWNYTTDSWIYSSPTVAYGHVYIGSCDKKVYCIDALTGGLIWNYSTGDVVESSPAVAYGHIFIGSYDDKVYCLNAQTGEPIWNLTTGGYVFSTPAIADGKVYVQSSDWTMYCLDAATGAIVWQYSAGNCPKLSAVWPPQSSPAVANGDVYIGMWTGEVYDFGHATQNYPPTFGTPSPANESTGQPTSLNWSIPINDPEGDLFDWTIQCSNGQASSGTSEHNGTKTLTLSSLTYLTTYTVWVNATDPGGSGIDTRQWYTFTTQSPPNNPILTFIDIKGGLLGLSVVVTNTGNGTAENVSWVMNATGTLFSPKLRNGTIGTLGPGENATIVIRPAYGLGKAGVTFVCTYRIMNLTYDVDFNVKDRWRDRALFVVDSFPERIQPTKEWATIENYSYVMNRSSDPGVDFHYGGITNMHDVRVTLNRPGFGDQVEFLAACKFTNGHAILHECWITRDMLMGGHASWEVELMDSG